MSIEQTTGWVRMSTGIGINYFLYRFWGRYSVSREIVSLALLILA